MTTGRLLVCLALVFVLGCAGCSLYCSGCGLKESRERILRNDLYAMRYEIGHYTSGKQKAPQSLSDLVNAGYLKRIPKDPMTASDTTWQVESDGAARAADPAHPGIIDVHSGSTALGSDGRTYNLW